MLTSALLLRDLSTGRPYNLTPAGSVLLSSAAAGWPRDVIIERHALAPAERPEHAVIGTRMMVNLGQATRYGWHDDDRPQEGVMPIGSVHLQPDGAYNRPRWSAPLDVATFAFVPALFDRLLDGRPLPAGGVIQRRGVPDATAHAYTSAMLAELQAPTELLYAELLCVGLAVHVLRAHGRAEAPVPQGRLAAVAARRVIDRMREGLSNKVTIASLAVEAGLSDAHFARAFTATFGTPPHRVILRWRLERAQGLIAHCGFDLARAAVAAGFYDQAHLTNSMRRHMGTTPGRI